MATHACPQCGHVNDEKAIVCGKCPWLLEHLVPDSLVQKRKTILESANPLSEKYAALIDLLWEATVNSEEGRPAPDGGQEHVDNFWLNTARALKAAGLHAAVTEFLMQCWDTFSRLQLNLGKRIYKAVFAHWIAQEFHDERRDLGAAARWYALAHLDDLLGKYKAGDARTHLRTVFGVSEASIASLDAIADGMLDEIGTDWAKPQGFPEWGLTKFMSTSSGAWQVLGRASGVAVHPACPAYVDALLKDIDAIKNVGTKAADTAAGERFEDLATYLFGTIPTCVPKRNMMPDTEAFENDLVVTNVSPQPTSITERLGRQFLVECKHWAKNIQSAVTGYFLYRMHLTHSTVGVLFTKQTITGANDDDSKYSRDLIRRAFHEDGLSCAWITLPEIEKLAADRGEQSMLDILLARLDEIQFGSPRSAKQEAEQS